MAGNKLSKLKIKNPFEKFHLSSKCDESVPDQKQQDPVDFLITSRIPEETCKFRWIIRQFSTLQCHKPLYSTSYCVLTTPSCLTLVKYESGFGLFHEAETTRGKNLTYLPRNLCQEFTLFEVSATDRKFTKMVDYEVSATDREFSKMVNYEVSATDGEGKKIQEWSVIFSSKFKNYWIGQSDRYPLRSCPDTLILDCNLKITLAPITEETPIASKPSLDNNSWQNLSTDFKALYQNSANTDVSLVVGNEEIRAHKLILAARSTVFGKTFHQDMKEAVQNTVHITDVQFPALKRLVEFLYSGVITDVGNTDMDLHELYDLYYAADKYEVMDLREMVGNTMLRSIQFDNAAELLMWADRHNDEDLKSKIMNFIRLNFDAVSSTNTWKSCALHNPGLKSGFVDFCAGKRKTGEIGLQVSNQ